MQKTARQNCWHSLGVNFGAYFVCLASKLREEINFEIKLLEGSRAQS
jgi:hypothetical protein